MIYRIILCFSLTHLSANLTAQVCDKDIPKIYLSDKAKAVYESKLTEAIINFENNKTSSVGVLSKQYFKKFIHWMKGAFEHFLLKK